MHTVQAPTDTSADPPAGPVPSPDLVRARELAAGYTALGDFFVAHPHLLRHTHAQRRAPMTAMLCSFYGPTARAGIGEFVTAARQSLGVEVEEYYERPYAGVRLTFAGSVQFRVYAMQGDLGAPRTARTRKYRPLLDVEPAGGVR